MWLTHKSLTLLLITSLFHHCSAAFNKKSSTKHHQNDAMAAFVRSSLPGPWVEPWEMPRVDTCLPQLTLIGANKAGILPWYWYARLGYHPALMVSKVENIEYFTVKYNTSMTLHKYTKLFPRICKRDIPIEGVLVGLLRTITSTTTTTTITTIIFRQTSAAWCLKMPHDLWPSVQTPAPTTWPIHWCLHASKNISRTCAFW